MSLKLKHHFINFFYRKLGLSRNVVYPIFSKINSLLPNKKHCQNEINTPLDPDVSSPISMDSGYKLFEANTFFDPQLVISECLEIFSKKKEIYDDQYFIKNPKKRFLLTIDSDENLLKNKHINNFVASKFVNNVVHHYLNHSYVLSTIRLWWTPVNDTAASSQKYHLDDEDLMQVKLFLNITDVSHEHGPFTFLPAHSSDIVLSRNRRTKRRYSDEEIYATLSKQDPISLVGTAGSGAFVDTSRCLHYGSRNNNQDRLVLMAQFLKQMLPY